MWSLGFDLGERESHEKVRLSCMRAPMAEKIVGRDSMNHFMHKVIARKRLEMWVLREGKQKKKVAFSLSALLAIRHNRLLHGNPSFVFVGLVVAASFSAGNHDVLRRVLPVFLFLS
jgi:hypothetical protein